MDTRYKKLTRRAVGGGIPSPAPVTPAGFLRKAHESCAFSFSAKSRKAHAACAFAVSLFAAVPALATEGASAFPAEAQSWLIGAAASGGAILAWLKIAQHARGAQRQPPIAEEAAKTYATKDELRACQGLCRRDMEAVRTLISTNDKAAEDRARGTHARIDKVYIAQQRNNKAMGTLIGIMIGKGIVPGSAISQLSTEEE